MLKRKNTSFTQNNIALNALALFVIIMFLAVGSLTLVGCAQKNEYQKLAEKEPNISYDEKTGLTFRNNYIIVCMAKGHDADIDQILAKYPEDIDSSFNPYDDGMADIGAYRVVLNRHYSYEELEHFAKTLEADPLVESASADLVAIINPDRYANGEKIRP